MSWGNTPMSWMVFTLNVEETIDFIIAVLIRSKKTANKNICFVGS